MIQKECALLLGALREAAPLVHQITNYVTVNDCANAALAIGASPIMADDLQEAAEIAGISRALVLNIGTLNSRTVASMLSAGKSANLSHVPVVLDPVGAGASKFRNDTVNTLLREVKFAVIRGNLSELSFLAGLGAQTKGVDTGEADAGNDPVAVAREVSRKFGCVSAITGAVDVISDGTRVVQIRNGHPMLSRVTGTGCMTSALVGAYCGAGSDYFTAAAAGVASMGLAGELAYEAAGESGTGSFHAAIIDALSRMSPELLMERGKMNEA